MRQIKFIYLLLMLFSVLQTSCYTDTPDYAYPYNTNPEYTWGYAEFYGAYYKDYNNLNNVISLSLFSDSLYINNDNEISGTGQYLYLEEIYIPPTDTILPNGIYRISKGGEVNTITPGEIVHVDKAEYVIGSYIYYIEKKSSYTTRKLISRGTVTVSSNGTKKTVSCDLVLNDSSKIRGSFSETLTYYVYKSRNSSKKLFVKQ